ncbi:MAG: cell division inhibitor SepF [Actinomycetota bacterium]|jgi:cell division inhibitor SepF|nr:cell division inhibitor SepF [Actinomycetota bacterium]
MAGAMRKAMVYLGLVEDEDHYDYDEEHDYDTETAEDGYASAASRSVAPVRDDGPHYFGATRGSVATMPERRPHPGTAPSRSFDRITTIHPRTYNEAKQIGESFRESTPVIMNLSDMDDADAKRLVDFAAGLVFGLRGTIERVTNKVFLLSPANVTVTAEDKARMAESGFFNQS